MEEYLGAKMLCDPLRLLDCDYPVSGACAVIITTAERARDLPHRVVGVAGHAQATGDGDWIFGEDFSVWRGAQMRRAAMGALRAGAGRYRARAAL